MLGPTGRASRHCSVVSTDGASPTRRQDHDRRQRVRCRASRPRSAAQVAMIFQHHNLVKRLSVLKNVLVGRMAGLSSVLRRCKYSRGATSSIAMALSGACRSSHKANARGDRLSGGEQQRIGIARALAQQPPSSSATSRSASLDPKTSRVVLGYLKAICKEEGIAVSAISTRSTTRSSSASASSASRAARWSRRYAGSSDRRRRAPDLSRPGRSGIARVLRPGDRPASCVECDTPRRPRGMPA